MRPLTVGVPAVLPTPSAPFIRAVDVEESNVKFASPFMVPTVPVAVRT
jgi:hypothetical protein